MYKSITVVTLTAALGCAPFFVSAGDTGGMRSDKTGKAAAQVHQGTGIVKTVDADAGKLNLSHEAIASLKWPKMTMDFKVQDKAMLAKIKPGMKVDFELAKFADGYRITRIAPAKN